MTLQEYLCNIFTTWSPPCPAVEVRTARNITLSWSLEPFQLLEKEALYRLEMRSKIPPWIVVYCGGKTIKTVENLPPRYPQQFRIKYIIKDTAVPNLAEVYLEHFKDEDKIYEHFRQHDRNNIEETKDDAKEVDSNENSSYIKSKLEIEAPVNEQEKGQGDRHIKTDTMKLENKLDRSKRQFSADITRNEKCKWLESLYSDETWTSTDSDGTSATCFCMAVRGGYLKQVHQMLEERPELIEVINPSNGLTPLATAVRKGDLNMVKLLLSAGADIEQRASSSQSPLQLATLAGHTAVVAHLLDRGADFQARDINELRIEHYAVDSGSVDMLRLVLDRAGDVAVVDGNHWTPLFRAVIQGAKTDIIEELILRGSDLNVVDKAGLTLPVVANLLKNRNGRCRESVLRLVDKQYPQQVARARFTRLTKKITNIHSIIK